MPIFPVRQLPGNGEPNTYPEVTFRSIIHLDWVFAINQAGIVMAESEKDRLAKHVADLRIAFDLALSDKRKYPVTEFNAFVRSARNYIKITAGDVMVHKSVVQAVNGLREFLQVERKRIPGNILFEADRLECQFFAGYDPSFDGDEAPGPLALFVAIQFGQRD